MPTLGDRIVRFGEEHAIRGTKYLVVSAFNVLFGQMLLVVFHAGLGLGFVASNLSAVAVGIAPAYVLSRSWVWERTGRSHLLREVLPFWALSFLGLAVSTGAVAVAERYSSATLVLMATNFCAFGIVWVAKYFILDQFLFARPGAVEEA